MHRHPPSLPSSLASKPCHPPTPLPSPHPLLPPICVPSGAYGPTSSAASLLSTTPPQDDAYLPPRSLALSADMFGQEESAPYDASAPPHRLTASSMSYAQGVRTRTYPDHTIIAAKGQ